MSETWTKLPLSASTNGRGVLVTATASAGTTIHTATAGTTNWDFVTIQASNTDPTTIKLVIEFGGTTVPNDDIVMYIPGQVGLVDVVKGLMLQNGCVVKAWAGTGSLITLFGEVNHLVP